MNPKYFATSIANLAELLGLKGYSLLKYEQELTGMGIFACHFLVCSFSDQT